MQAAFVVSRLDHTLILGRQKLRQGKTDGAQGTDLK